MVNENASFALLSKNAVSRIITSIIQTQKDPFKTPLLHPSMIGFLLIDKPVDITSHDVIARLRRITAVSYTHLTLPTIYSV